MILSLAPIINKLKQRYHANHAVMLEKLSKVNDTMRHLLHQVNEMDSTLLLVFGDHGMTMSGEHGGGSEVFESQFTKKDELNSALFAYTSKDLYFSNRNNDTADDYSTIYQVTF